jgi:metal-responsive CopG/Arc/MetJ family transcriptional regulator
MIPWDAFYRLEEIAYKTERSRSAVIRRAISNYLAKYTRAENKVKKRKRVWSYQKRQKDREKKKGIDSGPESKTPVQTHNNNPMGSSSEG